MIKRLLAAAAVAATAACASVPAAPDTAARDARVRAAMTETLENLRAEHGFPGAVAAVSLPDGVVIEAAVGVADREAGTPMTTEHKLLAGSIGKTFVAAAVLALAEDGALSLDDKVADHLGDRAWYADWPNAEAITIADLLDHGTGVATDYLEQEPFVAALQRTWEEDLTFAEMGIGHEDFAAMVAGTEPGFAPGEGFHYSDVSYLLAALIVEDVAGRDIEGFVDDRFLAPNGLDGIVAQHRDLPGVAAGYAPPQVTDQFGGAPGKAYEDGRFTYDVGFEWGGGGWATTAGDLARWARLWFGGGALEGDHVAVMKARMNPHVWPFLGDAYGPAMQYREATPFGESRAHGGYMIGYIAKAEYLPERDMALATMFNAVDLRYELYQNAVWEAVVAALEPESETPADAEDAADAA